MRGWLRPSRGRRPPERDPASLRRELLLPLLSTWRNDNELWESVWAKDGDEDLAFRPWPIEETHRPTFCVWELGAVWHEQQAWSRYLRSQRDEAAKQDYLRASYEGAV